MLAEFPLGDPLFKRMNTLKSNQYWLEHASKRLAFEIGSYETDKYIPEQITINNDLVMFLEIDTSNFTRYLTVLMYFCGDRKKCECLNINKLAAMNANVLAKLLIEAHDKLRGF